VDIEISVVVPVKNEAGNIAPLVEEIRAALKDETRDTGCGLKLIPRAVYLRLPYFDHMHRFLPALVKREGLPILFVTVNHRPRGHGKSNYGNLDRALVSVRDLMGVMWLISRCSLPASRTEL
jgi:dolichol-phosphate mannosyltransferase